MIDFSLAWLRSHLLDPVGARQEEWVLFGSSVLYLHGLRSAESVGDVDVFVSRRVWGLLLDLLAVPGDHGCTVETPRAGDPPFIAYRIKTPIHLFYDWTKRDEEWISVADTFEHAETVSFPILDVGGRTYADWRCASLDTVRTHKAKSYEANLGSAAHAKHGRDLKLIDERLGIGPGKTGSFVVGAPEDPRGPIGGRFGRNQGWD